MPDKLKHGYLWINLKCYVWTGPDPITQPGLHLVHRLSQLLVIAFASVSKEMFGIIFWLSIFVFLVRNNENIFKFGYIVLKTIFKNIFQKIYF